MLTTLHCWCCAAGSLSVMDAVVRCPAPGSADAVRPSQVDACVRCISSILGSDTQDRQSFRNYFFPDGQIKRGL